MNSTLRDNKNREAVYHLEFTLGEKRFALPLEIVERVVHAAEITIPPHLPELVEGLVNYRGYILPVVDISPRFHLPRFPLNPSFHFIIVTARRRRYALICHTVDGVIKNSIENIVAAREITEGVEYLSGVIVTENGMMMVPNLNKTLAFAPGEINALKKGFIKKDPNKKKK